MNTLYWIALIMGGSAGLQLWAYLRLVRAALDESARTDMLYFPVVPESLPWIDQTQLAAFTRDIENEGFVKILDLTTRRILLDSPDQATAPQAAAPVTPSPATATDTAFASSTHQIAPPIPDPGARPRAAAGSSVGQPPPPQEVKVFGRVFMHPQHGCVANILAAQSEMRLPDGRTQISSQPLQLAIVSRFGDDADYWTYATTGHEPLSYAELHFHPHGLFMRRAGAPLRELLRLHLEMVPKVARQIPVQLSPMRSAEEYLEFEQKLVMPRLRKIYARKNLWHAAFQLWTFKLRSHDEYWGALGKRPE